MPSRFRLVAAACAIALLSPSSHAEKPVARAPIGRELAAPATGVLIRAYPMTVQTNPYAPGGVGVELWGCEYRVGPSLITVAITTGPGDPMPCKRKTRFGG